MFLATLLACTWIDPEHAAWRLDPDGDGIAWEDDCDNQDPDVGSAITRYTDLDGDGFGADAIVGCPGAIDGTEQSGDCDDADPDQWPGNPERCDGADQDCDGVIDEGLEPLVDWYVDADGDGFGAGDVAGSTCAAPEGGALDGGDCDDTEPTVSPVGVEVTCDGVDQDCDGADVGEPAPGTFATLQDAIDAAPDDAWLCLDAGLWEENLSITRPVTLQGVGRDTILDGGGAGTVVTTTAASTLLGLTVQNGDADGGAGIHTTAALALEDVLVQDNVCPASACTGTGIWVEGGDLIAHDLEVSGNLQAGGTPTGAGIACLSGTLDLTDAWIHANEQVYTDGVAAGGGVYSTDCDVVFERVEVSENVQQGEAVVSHAYAHGAGVEVAWGRFVADELDVHDNVAQVSSVDVRSLSANGIVTVVNAEAVWSDAMVADNLTTCAGPYGYVDGGAVYVGDTTLDGNTVVIARNQVRFSGAEGALTRGGGAKFVQSTLTIDGLDLLANDVDVGPLLHADGAGAYMSDATVTLRHARIIGNVAHAGSASGVALYIEGDMSITNGVIAANGIPDSTSGYVVNTVSGSLELTNVDIAGNTVANGGALRVGSANTTLRNVSFVGNRNNLGGAGGAITDGGGGAETNILWCNLYDNGPEPVLGRADPVGSDGNISVDPLYQGVTGDAEGWDLRLGEGSACIDAGDETMVDVDGSRADIGAFGGPASSW